MAIIDTPHGQRVRRRDGSFTMLDGSPCANPFTAPVAAQASSIADLEQELGELRTYRDAAVIEMADLKGQVIERDATILKLEAALKAANEAIARDAGSARHEAFKGAPSTTIDEGAPEPGDDLAAAPADGGKAGA